MRKAIALVVLAAATALAVAGGANAKPGNGHGNAWAWGAGGLGFSDGPRPIAPPDLLATFLHGFDIDPGRYLRDGEVVKAMLV